MGGLKVVTKKLVPFHGRDEEFTNVYYFGNGGISNPTPSESEAVINAVIEGERAIFANVVRFVSGTSYMLNAFNKPVSEPNAFVEKAANVMGLVSPTSGMYRECAVDVRFILSGRRILRSLLHTCNDHGIATTGATAPTSGFSSALNTWTSEMAGANYKNTGYRRISPSGQSPTGTWINPYMEHRQFHRYRRRFD